jgi:hypothetical protein
VATRNPFPVLCDRCRAEGLAGEAEFVELADLGDLLDFEPVPRRVARADGWTPEIQRAYVAALAVTGSERRACAVVERAAYGITQLRKAKGNESFLAACDKATEIWHERERVRRSDNLLAAARGEAARTRGRPRLAWSAAQTRGGPPTPTSPEAPPDPAREEERRREFLGRMLRLYNIKLKQEREARLAGEISAADFYARQVTFLEAWADLVGTDLFRLMTEWREGEFGLLDIAQTPMSRLLDDVRREHFARCGEPGRPPPPAPDLLVDHGRFSTEPLEYCTSDSDRTMNEQLQDFADRHRRDAEAQVEWEAKARRDYERRRDSAADHGRRDGEGRPACGSADRTDVTNSVRDGPEAEGEDPADEPGSS